MRSGTHGADTFSNSQMTAKCPVPGTQCPVPSTQLRSPARASFCCSRPRTDGGKAAAAAAADGNENESRIGENTKCGTLSEGRKLVELETKVILRFPKISQPWRRPSSAFKFKTLC